MSRSRMIGIAPGTWFTGFYGLNFGDRSAIHTAKAQTLPGEVLRGTVEIIMHFKSTASFADHGRTPFVDCELARLSVEPGVLLPWTKHECCHTYRLNEVVEKSASPVYRLPPRPHRRNGQLVRIHRRRVAASPDRRTDDATPTFIRHVPPILMPILMNHRLLRSRDVAAIAIER